MADAAAPVAVLDCPGGPLAAHAIEIRDSAINIEEIMARIRRSIAEKRRSRAWREDALLVQGVDLLAAGESGKNLADHLTLLQYAGRLDLEGEPISSHRPWIGTLIKLAKRVNRFWVRKYTDGLFTRQNHFNAETVAVLRELTRRIDELKAENEALRKKLESLPPR